MIFLWFKSKTFETSYILSKKCKSPILSNCNVKVLSKFVQIVFMLYFCNLIDYRLIIP